jgi:hypothetical protein
LNVRGFNDDIQTEIHTAEQLVPTPSVFEVELATEELKRHISPGINQFPAELITAGGRKFCYEIRISIWNKEELPEVWKS